MYMILISWDIDMDSAGKVCSELHLTLTASQQSMPFFDIGE